MDNLRLVETWYLSNEIKLLIKTSQFHYLPLHTTAVFTTDDGFPLTDIITDEDEIARLLPEFEYITLYKTQKWRKPPKHLAPYHLLEDDNA